MMMMMGTNPFQNAFSSTVHSLGNWTYGLNERGKRRATQLRAEAEAAPSFLKPVAKAGASPLATLLTNGTKTDFDHFSFTPELGGFTIPHLPLMLTLIMFYGFMMPARVDSELKRADKLTPQELQTEGVVNKGIRQIMKAFYRDEKKADGTKKENKVDTVDVRPVRDVIIRDMLSISLFLFALEPAQQALRIKKQNDGGLFSLGKNNTQPVLAIMDRPWSPNGEMEAWSYEKTNRLYQLNNLNATENFASLFGGNTYNRQSGEIFRRAVTTVNLYADDAKFKTTTDDIIGQLHQLGTTQNKLTNAFKAYYETHQLTAKKNVGVDENLALGLLFEKLPTLKNYSTVKSLNQHQLITEVTAAKETIQHKIKEALAQSGFDMGALEQLKAAGSAGSSSVHHTHKPFAEHFLKAYHEGDREAYHKMMLLASNVGGFVDSVVEKQGNPHKQARFERYGTVWHQLQGLQDLVPQYHLLRHTEALLTAETVPANGAETGFLAGIKGLFNHSEKALNGIGQLDFLTKEARKNGKPVGVKNLFGKVADTFNPTDVFKEFARSMKAPVDWMTFVLVAGVIGFVPVWINQVYTDLEFKFKHANDKHPPEPESIEVEDLDYLPLVAKSGTKSMPAVHRFEDLANQ
jgi:hypothetical protein